MKKNVKVQHAILSIGVIAFLLLESCAPNESDNPAPTDDQDKYIGTWSCAETSSNNGASTFDVTLRKNSNVENQLLIDNFYLLGASYSAAVTKSGSSLTLASQSISGNTVQGNGSISSDTKISLTYTVNDGSGASGTDNCSAILTKR